MVQMLTLSNWIGILKIIFIALGLKNIPLKDKNYLTNKKKQVNILLEPPASALLHSSEILKNSF